MASTSSGMEYATPIENVRVIVRARPQSSSASSPCTYSLSGRTVSLPKEGFVGTYDQIFGPTATNAEVYSGTAAPLVKAALAGNNVTVLAYGVTSSGKTHTMVGPELDGVIPRFAADLFAAIREAGGEAVVHATFLEVYNRQLFDLLRVRGEPLKLRGTQPVYVEGLSSRAVHDAGAVVQLLDQGRQAQHTRGTELNQRSSRSHTIFTLDVEFRNKTGARRAKIALVDLAGSENVKLSQVEGEGLREASEINTALTALGNVIAALHRRQSHVPYRDSKITHLLQDSLGGSARTVLIATVCPEEQFATHTLGTLKFAARVSTVENVVRVHNVEANDSTKLREAMTELARLRSASVAPTQSDLAVVLDRMSAIETRFLDQVVPDTSALQRSLAEREEVCEVLRASEKSAKDLLSRLQSEWEEERANHREVVAVLRAQLETQQAAERIPVADAAAARADAAAARADFAAARAERDAAREELLRQGR